MNCHATTTSLSLFHNLWILLSCTNLSRDCALYDVSRFWLLRHPISCIHAVVFVGSSFCALRLPSHNTSRYCNYHWLVVILRHQMMTELGFLQGTYTLLVHAHASVHKSNHIAPNSSPPFVLFRYAQSSTKAVLSWRRVFEALSVKIK